MNKTTATPVDQMTTDQLTKAATPWHTYEALIDSCRRGYVPSLPQGLKGRRGQVTDMLAYRVQCDGYRVFRGMGRTGMDPTSKKAVRMFGMLLVLLVGGVALLQIQHDEELNQARKDGDVVKYAVMKAFE